MADEWLEGVGEGASSWPTLDFAVTGDSQPGIQMVDGRNRAQKTETRRRFAVCHELLGGGVTPKAHVASHRSHWTVAPLHDQCHS